MKTIKLKSYIISAVMIFVIIMLFSSQIFCNDIFSMAEEAAGNTTSKIASLASAVLPLVFVISLICLVFTRDPKKVMAEVITMVVSGVAFIGIQWVTNGDALRTTLAAISSVGQ